MKAQTLRKRRLQRARRAKDKNPISAVKTRPKEDPRRVALEARQRVLGVSAEDATQPEAGTVLGRLKLSGTITESMYEAGKRYLALYQNHLKAISAPVGLAQGSGSVDAGEPSEEYVEWATRAVAHYKVMKAALEDICCRHSVEDVVVHDINLPWLYRCQVGLELLAYKMGLENLPRAA